MVRLKKISVPTDFTDFPQYALNRSITFTCQCKSEVCVLHVMNRGIVDAMVNICVEDYFDDTSTYSMNSICIEFPKFGNSGGGLQ